MHDLRGAEYAIGGGMAISGRSSGVGARGGSVASTTTAEQVPVGACSVVKIQTVAAAKGSDSGDGGTAGVDIIKAQELGSPQQE